MLGFKIHEVLIDIMNNAYKGNEFTNFFIEMIPKEYATIHGRYYYRIKKIEIFNLSRDSKKILVTTIHELAHHVDVNIRKRTGHDKYFYAVHYKLLTTAVGMGVITLDDIADITDSYDASNLEFYCGNILEWECPPIEYKNGKLMIKVKFAFSIKDSLKKRGYKYSKDEKIWEKEILREDFRDEKEFLLGITKKQNIIVRNSSDVDFQIIYEIVAHTVEENFSALINLKYKRKGTSKMYCKFIKSTQLANEINALQELKLSPIKLKVSGKQAYSN